MIEQKSMKNAVEIKGQSFTWGVKNEEKKETPKKKDKKVKEETVLPILEEDASVELDQSQKTPLIEKSMMQKDETKIKKLESIITLKNINISVTKGELICVIGDVGSGKSSLLQTLIGDLLYVSPSQILKYGGSSGLEKEIVDSEQIESFQKDLI
jgi:ABC-type transport system involved in cytochrome bd biosynthesis fused ATPase/permease subunit